MEYTVSPLGEYQGKGEWLSKAGRKKIVRI